MEDSFHLLAGWLIDGLDHPIRKNVVVEVHSGVIRSVHRLQPEQPRPFPLLDFSNCTVLPGLVDAHVHLCMSGSCDPEVRRRQLNTTYDQARPFIEEHLASHLNHGIVAVRDGGDASRHTHRFRNEHTADIGRTPFLHSPGMAWRAKGRYGRFIGRALKEGLALPAAIQEQHEAIDHVKILNSGINSLLEFGKQSPPQFDADALSQALRCARDLRLKTMIHANGRAPVGGALQTGCDSIEHGFFMGRENLYYMAERQVFWVPTAHSMQALARELPFGSTESDVARRNLDDQLEQIRSARELGVPVVLGTDSGGFGLHHGKAFLEEFKLLLQCGFTVQGAVRCAGYDAARLMGLDGQVGTIRKGAVATLLVARGTPNDLPDALQNPVAVFFKRFWHGQNLTATSGLRTFFSEQGSIPS